MADGPDQPVYLLTGSDRPKIQLALERMRRHFAPEAVETVSAIDTSGEAAVALWDDTLAKVRQAATERLAASRRRRRED